MIRAAGALLLATLALVALPTDATAEPRERCSICTLHEDADPDAPLLSVATVKATANTVCRISRALTCADRSECWMGPFIAVVVGTAERAALLLPPIVLCAGSRECGANAPFLWIMGFIAALTLLVDAGRILIAGAGEWTHVATRMFRIGVAVLIGQAVLATPGHSLSDLAWDWTGHSTAAGALMGRAVAMELRHAVENEANPSASGCSGLDVFREQHHPDHAQTTLHDGWYTVRANVQITFTQAVDLATVMAGAAWLVVPSWSKSLSTAARSTIAVFTGDWCAVFNVIRYLFAVVLFGIGIMIALTVAFSAFEALLTLGIMLGLLPILGWMWVWQPTREAPRQALAATLYAALSLAFLALTLQIAYHAMELTLRKFAVQMQQPFYPEDHLSALYEACEVPPPSESSNLFEAFDALLCLSRGDAVTIEAPSTSPGGLCAAAIVKGKDIEVRPSKLEHDVIAWLPQLILLIAGGVIANAIMRYGATAAAEISGYRAPANQIAQQFIGAGRAVVGGGARRMGAMFGKK